MNCVASEISLELGNQNSLVQAEMEEVEEKKRQLDLLMRYSALNDSFSIWFDDGYITVNGLRVGRVGNQVGKCPVFQVG